MSRTGRRPGVSGSREAILEAARTLFAERGYEGASLRAIGASAGVDAALVVHFFGSKANLLEAAVDWPFDPDTEIRRVLAGGRRNVGRGIAELMVTTWEHEGSRNSILTLLRSASTEPRAAALMREFTQQRLFAPLLAALGSDRPEMRGELAASQLIGLGMARHVLRYEPLASAPVDEVVALVGPTLQRYLAGKL